MEQSASFRIASLQELRCDGIALSLCMAAFPVAGQIQSIVFGPSGNSSITALRAGRNGDLVIAGTANGGGVPLVNAFQSRFASSGMEITRNGGRTWQMGQRPTMKDYLYKLVVDPKDANTVCALGQKGVYRSVTPRTLGRSSQILLPREWDPTVTWIELVSSFRSPSGYLVELTSNPRRERFSFRDGRLFGQS